MRYSATFSNGVTITRNSDKAYTHAYYIKNHWNAVSKGFAGSEDLARKACKMQHGNVTFAEVVPVTAE